MKPTYSALLTALTPLIIGTSAHAAAWTQLDLTGATTRNGIDVPKWSVRPTT